MLRAPLREEAMFGGRGCGLVLSIMRPGPAKAPVHAREKAGTGATQANLPVPRASACGIPASKPLSVLDRDKAYFYSDACTVYRVPVDGYDKRISFPWLSLLCPAFVFSQKVSYLVVCRTLYTFSMTN